MRLGKQSQTLFPEEMLEIPAVCAGVLHGVPHTTEKDLQEVGDVDS